MLTAVSVAFALSIAACGGSDDDAGDASTDDGATEVSTAPAGSTAEGADGGADEGAETEDTAVAGGDGLAAAQAVVDANLTPPTDIGPTIPLESVPEKKTVAWLECSLPSCAAIGIGFEDAVAALGWDLEVISWSTDAAAAFQQAIDQGVDYVAITGTPPALIQDQLDAAAAAGIPAFSCFDSAVPDPEVNNLYVQCGDATAVERAGDLIANAIIADSGGDANVLMVNIPDFTVLQVERDASAAAYEANCPDCTFNELALTLDQLLAGEVPGAIVSALQSDPDVDYLHFAFDGVAGGVVPTLEDAGLLEGRSLVGVDYNGVILQDIVDGKQKFWTTNPKEYSAWLMVDGMARHAIGQENTEERANALLPTFIVNSAEVAEPLIPTDGWTGPEDMAAQFTELWGV